MPVLPCQRNLFDIPDEVAYLNCAYMSPLLKSVTEAGRRGVDSIGETIGPMVDDLASRAAEIGLDTVPTARRARHYVGLRFPGGVPAGLPGLLAAERVFVSVRGRGALRVTPHVYNDRADLDRLLRAIQSARSA
jgi:selenocysteine lyase/cysteine desulfurase